MSNIIAFKQSLVTKLVILLNYNLTQYLFIESEF